MFRSLMPGWCYALISLALDFISVLPDDLTALRQCHTSCGHDYHQINRHYEHD